MKRKILSVFLMFTMVMAVVSCNGNATATSEDPMLYSVDDTQPVILEEATEENQDLFLANEDAVADTSGVCLMRKNDCYSLMDIIPIENSYQYDIGLRHYEKAAIIYWTVDDYNFVSSDDFEPLVARVGDKIRSYKGELAFRPVKFERYSIRAYVSPGSQEVSYYAYEEDGIQSIGFYKEKNFSICDVNGNSVEFEDLKQGEEYVMKWGDDYGTHELPMIANSRFYTMDGADVIIDGQDKGEYLEYDVSNLPAGTYAIIAPEGVRGGSIITVK